MSKHSDDFSPELEELGDRLREERPTLDAFAYDRGQQRARRAADGPRRRSRRPSLAVALCICLGAILSSGGAGLAVSGLASTDSTAVEAQYPTTPTTTTTATTPTTGYTTTTPTTGYTTTTPTQGYTTTTTTTTETTETIGTAPTVAGNSSGGGSSPSVAGETASGTSPTQAAAQTGATQGSGSLPFTGFAAVPVMLVGLALLMAGVMLRRRRATDL